MFAKSLERNVLVLCVAAIMLIDCCYSSTFITPPISHPDHPGKCFEPVTMQVLKPGQDMYLPHGCIKLTCLKTLQFGGSGCASETAIGKNCREIPGDRSQVYPYCCPQYECDEDNSDGFEYGSNSL